MGRAVEVGVYVVVVGTAVRIEASAVVEAAVVVVGNTVFLKGVAVEVGAAVLVIWVFFCCYWFYCRGC